MMKKLIAVLTALTLAASMSVSTQANELTGQEAGQHAIGVQGKYNAGTAVDDVISVDITWEGLEFTYTAGSTGTWKPDQHVYEGGTLGHWSENKGSITVANHSNVAVTASFQFAFADSLKTDGKDTQGLFYTLDDSTYTETTDAKFELESAVDKTRSDNAETDQTPKGTIYFGMKGNDNVIFTDGTIGTITVSIVKKTGD